jgi:hypothetical protein
MADVGEEENVRGGRERRLLRGNDGEASASGGGGGHQAASRGDRDGSKKKENMLYFTAIWARSDTRVGRVKLSGSTQSWPKIGRKLERVRTGCLFESFCWATFLVSDSPIRLFWTRVVR